MLTIIKTGVQAISMHESRGVSMVETGHRQFVMSLLVLALAFAGFTLFELFHLFVV